MDFSSEFVLAEDETTMSNEPALMDDEDDDDDDGTPECAFLGSDDDDEEGGGGVTKFEAEIMGFNDEEMSAPGFRERNLQSPMPKSKPDPNQVSLPLNIIATQDTAEVKLPDVKLVVCSNPEGCGAYLSHIDTPSGGPDKIWTCKFCGHKTTVENWPDITRNDVLYSEESGQRSQEVRPAGQGGAATVFVLDISGSMCSSMQISPSRLTGNLKKFAEEERDALIQAFGFIDGGGIAELQPITHVSRICVMKAALIECLEAMDPSERAGLVVFNDHVMVYGDGTGAPLDVPLKYLDDGTKLEQAARELRSLKTLRESRESLIRIIKDMKENKDTALGPALHMGIALAMLDKPSKVMLCTDGLANRGVGQLQKGADQSQSTKEFYRGLIDECQHKGVTVQIVSFLDDDCNIGMQSCLGEVPVKTGGEIHRSPAIDPSLSEIVKSVVNTPIIATGADIRFVVHKNMFVKDSSQDSQSSCYSRMLGNVNSTKRLAMAYGFKTNIDQADDGDQPEQYPFQFQIEFKDLQGQRMTRVWTNLKPMTKNRAQAEENCDWDTRSKNFLQTAAESLLNAAVLEKTRLAKRLREECDDLLRNYNRHFKTNNSRLMAFLKCMKKIGEMNQIDDSAATYLRNLQTGGLIGT